MTIVKGCTFSRVKIEGKIYQRDSSYSDRGKKCHDCGISNGQRQYHHFGCDMERCPKCDGQFAFCDCDKTKLLK